MRATPNRRQNLDPIDSMICQIFRIAIDIINHSGPKLVVVVLNEVVDDAGCKLIPSAHAQPRRHLISPTPDAERSAFRTTVRSCRPTTERSEGGEPAARRLWSREARPSAGTRGFAASVARPVLSSDANQCIPFRPCLCRRGSDTHPPRCGRNKLRELGLVSTHADRLQRRRCFRSRSAYRTISRHPMSCRRRSSGGRPRDAPTDLRPRHIVLSAFRYRWGCSSEQRLVLSMPPRELGPL